MLAFLQIAAPAAIVIAAVIRTIILCGRNRTETTQPASQGLSYTVHAESGYQNADNRYVFTLTRLPQGYRCYIDRTPSYRERDTDPNVIHRLKDARGYYICYTKDLPQLEQAKTLCRQWSDLTQRYIETGTKFDE